MPDSANKPLYGSAIAANLLIFAVWGYAEILQGNWKDFYYRSAQEDEYIEWGTFWAFLLAAVIWVVAAMAQRRKEGKLPWFLLGLSAFCFVVAMEEISWGQRVFSYRPPAYFLEKNDQQELNLHNVVEKDLRKLALKGVILGYGVLLPLLFCIPPLRRFLTWASVIPPPIALLPAFLGTFVLYEKYPWSFTGEWVELMLGFGFLFAALAAAHQFLTTERLSKARGLPVLSLVTVWLVILGLGGAQASLSRVLRRADPEMIATAETELAALKSDFLSGRVRSRCSRHKRLYSFKEKYRQEALVTGDFAALTAQGLPEERALFLLDPWNSPYWIRDRCKSGGSRRVVFVYSFGPNRRRDSSRYEIEGDDVGAVIYDGKKIADITGGR